MAQSEMLTHDGYPAVKLEDGSHMTEYSITVTDPRLNNGRPTNIPSLWERKIVDQDTAVNKAIQSKKEYKSFDTIRDAVSDSERKSNAGGANAPKEYNRGGTVRNLLATGGMMQEGGTVDPVSGNDVPTGSLKEEVRDDIPAQLSPGEFVFPADVTRYIGLDKLMQIREAAKEGLKEMESKGQMGNAEEVADDVVDEDKFSTNIDEIIAGLDGGDDSEPQEFAEGGVVKTDPSYKDAPIKGFRMVQYEDPETKAVKYIPFVNGKALLPIPKGYVEKKPVVPTTPPTTPPVEEQPVSPVGGGNGGGGRGGRPETDGDGGGVSVQAGDTGIEGFGDIQSGTSPNIARALGAGIGFFSLPVGAVVSALGQYSIKKDNEKMANANAQAISFSALKAAGFDDRDIKAAQEAAAKATMEGKSAKDIAVAAANAASLGTGPGTAKTSLDALVGITNGWNTTNAENLKTVNSIPSELAGKISPGFWGSVTKSVDLGLTPAQAVAEAQIDAEAEAFGGVPAGKYADVVKDVKDGMSVKDAIAKANAEEGVKPDAFMQTTDVEGLTPSDRNMAVQREAKEKADKEQAQQAASERATQQAASERAAQQAATDRETDRREAAEARDRAATDAERAALADADRAPVRESSSGGRGGSEAPGTGGYGDARGALRGGGFND